MKIRQARKLANNAHGKPTVKIIKALKTIWSRNTNIGNIPDETVRTVAKILTGELKV